MGQESFKEAGMYTVAGGHARGASSLPQAVKGKSDEPDEHTENGVALTGPVQLPELGQSLT